ncbi:futalosine hydrolase [Paenibacillus thermotolerans]|uniref:futalosine hydrolase n=1 Tax=Paenibacillus thermotolerans TaxID=3027807 RepID=UPI002367B6E1|nr:MULTISPECIES: futalosine hydrolase [unclassified Paenibacillus]
MAQLLYDTIHDSKRILVMTAVEAERDAFLRGLHGNDRFEVSLAGVGPASAAARTAAKLASGAYGLVISVGIGGGFSGKADPGGLVVADAIIAADLGVETQEGFQSVDELGFGSSRIEADQALAVKVAGALADAGLPVTVGPVLTVTTATGTAATAAELASRIPGAAGEAMEGYGVAIAAQLSGLPVLEIRAVSNRVGPRDRSAWRMKEAFEAIEAAGKVLAEVLTA